MPSDRQTEIQARVEKATPGPWRIRRRVDRGYDLKGTDTLYEVCAGEEKWFDNKGNFHPDEARYALDEIHVAACSYDRDYGYPEGGIKRREDAEFIANAREDIPWLLAELSRVQQELDWKSAEVEMLRGVGCNEDGDGPCGACLKCARAERDALQQEIATLRRGLESLRRSHDTCEDGWYSCPLSDEGCLDTSQDGCTCGAEAHNAKLDALLQKGQ